MIEIPEGYVIVRTIVRCKDCKYWVVDYPDGEEFWSCDKWQGWAIGDYFTEDDFCSRGEKKEKE